MKKKYIIGTLMLLMGTFSYANDTNFKKDREAILKLAGEFQVTFSFEETYAIKEGYELKKPYKETAHELVKVVSDKGDEITLQHLLVVTPKLKEGEDKVISRVIKHWSQTWKYEDTQQLNFIAKRNWESNEIKAEQAKGTWSQLVTQVDDSPRYKGYGKWIHTDGRSMWVSNLTNRPLPRREYTKRKDYDIVECINRHVITVDGWAHEQHNAKLVSREGERNSYIAHEIGLNVYKRVNDFNFTAATEYWDTYGMYWDQVREIWNEIYEESDKVKIERYVNEETLRDMTYEAVEIAEEDKEKVIPDLKKKISAFLSN